MGFAVAFITTSPVAFGIVATVPKEWFVTGAERWPVVRDSRLVPEPIVAACAVMIPTAKVTNIPVTMRVSEGTTAAEIRNLVSVPTTITVGMVTAVYVTIMPFVLVIVPIKEAGLLVSKMRPDSSMRIFMFDKDITTRRFITTTGEPVFTSFFVGNVKFGLMLGGVPAKCVIRAEAELAAVIIGVRADINLVCSVPWASDILRVVRGVTDNPVLSVGGFGGD